MKTLMFCLGFVFFDAIVPRSCRSNQETYTYEDDTLYNALDTLDYKDADSVRFDGDTLSLEDADTLN